MSSNLRDMDPGETPHTLQTEMKASSEADGPALKDCEVNARKRKVSENDDGQAGKTKREADKDSASCSVDVAPTKAEVRGERKKTRRRAKKRNRVSPKRLLANFVDKYWQLDKIGAGGYGAVYAGYRKADWRPVAIKRVQDKSLLKPVCLNGRMLPTEVAIMMKLQAEKNDSPGMSAPIELIEWYDLGNELILVLERPFFCKDLHKYTHDHGAIPEWKAKILMRQLVNAAVGLEKRQIFHRDIKLENILIDIGYNVPDIGYSVPEVRLIDFGMSQIVDKDTIYTTFSGTEAYIPPEWYFQSCFTPGPATVWQVGVVLFEILKKVNFTTEDYLKRKLKMPSKVSKDCKDFIQLCLRTDPALRSTLTELQQHPWLR